MRPREPPNSNDAGLSFHAILLKADGTRITRETDNRRELLAWIARHRHPGDTVMEVGLVASGVAAEPMLSAIAFGGRQQGRPQDS